MIALDILGAALAMVPPLFAILVFDFALPEKNFNLLLLALGAGFLTYLLSFVITAWGDYLNAKVDHELTAKIAVDGFERIEKASISKLHDLKVGDLLDRLLNASDVITGLVINLPARLIISILQLFIFFGVSYVLDPWVALLGLLAIPIYFLESRYFGSRMRQQETVVRVQQSDLYEGLQEKLLNLKSIKTFGQGERERNKLMALFVQFGYGQLKQKVSSIFQAFSSSLILQVWTALITVYLGYEVIRGALSIGEMITLGIYLPLVQQPIQDLAGLWMQTKIGSVSLERFAQLEDLPSEQIERNLKTKVDASIFQKEVSFESVDFSFNKFPVLKSFNAQFPAQKLTAIVGPSGIGKSTLAHLFLGMYLPDSGNIMFGNTEIRNIDVSTLREHVGILFQEPPLFAGTIRENILFGNESASDANMMLAASMAQAESFIHELPKGFDTPLRWGGSNLSVGQRQRVALAQTLLRRPEIMILDEPTSALDAESEFHLGEVIESLRKKMTIVLLSHSLATVKQADQILFVDHGRVVEQGSFAELMEKKAYFFDLYHIQMGGFQEFRRRVDIEIERHRRYKQPLGLILLKLSESSMEDTLRMVRKHLRVMDFCSQYLKDQLVLCLPEAGAEGVQLAADRIKKLLDENSISFQQGLAWCEANESIYSESLFNAAELNLKSS
jgi:ABC-type multidrug transport system fused ATPase/permease subunit